MVQMMKNRWGAVGALCLAGSVVLVGCGQSQDSAPQPSSSPSSSVNVEAPDAVAGGASASATAGASQEPVKGMEAGKVSPEQLSAVKDYLAVRENRESLRYADAGEYEAALGGVTTVAGKKQVLEHYRVDDTSGQRLIAQQGGYEVDPQVTKCSTNPAYAKEGSVAVMCSLSDLVTKDGKPVPLNDVAQDWVYFGVNAAPTVVLKQEGGRWLVDADYTGLAS